MSNEFLRIAKQEIQTELDKLQEISIYCNNDEQIFQNSKDIEGHLHKIKGLAPMIGQDIVGEIAKIADVVMKHIIENGSLIGSCKFTLATIENMKNLFNKQQNFDIDDFRKTVRQMFPQISP